MMLMLKILFEVCTVGVKIKFYDFEFFENRYYLIVFFIDTSLIKLLLLHDYHCFLFLEGNDYHCYCCNVYKFF